MGKRPTKYQALNLQMQNMASGTIAYAENTFWLPRTVREALLPAKLQEILNEPNV